MRKTFVLDTNILLHNPNALMSFEENIIILPDVVIDELDNHKTDKGEVGANARQAARMLDDFRNHPENGNLLDGYDLPNGGILKVEMNCVDTQMPASWSNDGDLRILRVCKGLKEKGNEIIFVSNDNYAKIKASILGIIAQDFTTESVSHPDELYAGRREAYASSAAIDNFHKEGKMDPAELRYYSETGEGVEEMPLVLHEYVVVKANDCNSKSAIGFFDGEYIVHLDDEDFCPCGLIPRNVGQKYMIDAFKKSPEQAPLVIVKGPAGTAKTLMAIAVGLEEVMNNGTYKRILYLRGNTKLDEEIGFLPGSETEKLDWALRPVRDNLEVIFAAPNDPETKKRSRKKNAYGSDYDKNNMSKDDILKDKIAEVFERGYISIEAVAFMRGRSVSETYVIIDEAQNLTPKQIRTLLSRCSSDTKIILLGDPNQIDHPYLDYRTNGLCYAGDRMTGSETTYQITMIEEECERSVLSKEIADRMGDK